MGQKISTVQVAQPFVRAFFSIEKIVVKKGESPLETQYKALTKLLEEIELPNGFTPQLVVGRIREYEEENQNILDSRKKLAEIQARLSHYRSLVVTAFASKREYARFPEYLWEFLDSLKTFQNHVADELEQKRSMIGKYFFTTDVPLEFIDLCDISNQNEKISSRAISKIIEDIKKNIVHSIRSSESTSIPQRTFFYFAVSRAGKGRMRIIIKKQFERIELIFEKTGKMEDARIKLTLYLDVWNAKDIKDLPHPDVTTMKNVDKSKFDGHLEEFKEKYQECRKFLIDNFYDIFLDLDLIRDQEVQKAWNEMVDAILA